MDEKSILLVDKSTFFAPNEVVNTNGKYFDALNAKIEH